jgi:hypothetical protein
MHLSKLLLKRICFHSNSALTTIGKTAFAAMSIESIDFPDSLATIEGGAFRSTLFLKTVKFGICSHLSSIGVDAFQASALEAIDFPSSLECVGPCTFGYCKFLRSVSFEKTVLKQIAKDTFFDSGLFEILLPTTLESIDLRAFYSCGSLWHISLNDGVRILCGFGDSGLVKISIPDSVEVIAISCFEKCRFLRRVFFGVNSRLTRFEEFGFAYSSIVTLCIPRGVAQIECQAFLRCCSLKSLSFVGTMDNRVFSSGVFTDRRCGRVFLRFDEVNLRASRRRSVFHLRSHLVELIPEDFDCSE